MELICKIINVFIVTADHIHVSLLNKINNFQQSYWPQTFER